MCTVSEINDNECSARVAYYNGSAFGIHREESSPSEYLKKKKKGKKRRKKKKDKKKKRKKIE